MELINLSSQDFVELTIQFQFRPDRIRFDIKIPAYRNLIITHLVSVELKLEQTSEVSVIRTIIAILTFQFRLLIDPFQLWF